MNIQIDNKISNETVLRQKLIESWGNFDEEIKRKVGPLEAEYKFVRKRQRIAFGCFGAMAVLFGFADSFGDSSGGIMGVFGDVFGTILAILFFPIVIVLGFVGWRFMRDKNNVVYRFNLGINKILFPKAIALFGLSGSYIESDKEGSSAITDVTNLLKHSELVTEPHNRTDVDDMMHIPWTDGKDGELFIAELDLKHVTGSGKNRKVKHIFSGYFVSFDLERSLEGKTFISTEGDTKGFGHQSFWKSMTDGEKIEVTELEWNDFENLLHVATSNPTEARYILTTNFMTDLYDWWKDKKRNIRIAFIGSRMYVLFPDKGIRFNKTVPSLESDELQEYAMTIAKPLMHILHLVEDVKV